MKDHPIPEYILYHLNAVTSTKQRRVLDGLSSMSST